MLPVSFVLAATESYPQRMGLPKINRPAKISHWVQYARAKPIVVDNADIYERKWWKWWSGMNPAWRVRSGDRPQQGGTGDWDGLLKSGLNGFLSVLTSLVALCRAAEDQSWCDAMEDVRWALQEVVLAAREKSAGYVIIPLIS